MQHEDLSARQIQEELLQLGLIDRFNKILDPNGIHSWALPRRVAAPRLDAALGLPQGTTALFTIQNNLEPLTGDPWPRDAGTPVPDGIQYGSGFEGTQAPPAGPADVYGPNDPLGPPPETPEQRHARFQAWDKEAGFDPVVDFLAYVHGAYQQGFIDGEIEQWTGWPAGTIVETMLQLNGLMLTSDIVPEPHPTEG